MKMSSKRRAHHASFNAIVKSERGAELLETAHQNGMTAARKAIARSAPHADNLLRGTDNQTKRMNAEVISAMMICEAQGFMEVAIRRAFKPDLLWKSEVESTEQINASLELMGDWANDLAKEFKGMILRHSAQEASDTMTTLGASDQDVRRTALRRMVKEVDADSMEVLLKKLMDDLDDLIK